MDLTCSMVGGVEWGLSTKKNNTVPLMLAELMTQGFKTDDLEELKRTDDVVKLRAMLKQHKWEQQVKTKPGRKLSNVKNLKPISEEICLSCQSRLVYATKSFVQTTTTNCLNSYFN